LLQGASSNRQNVIISANSDDGQFVRQFGVEQQAHPGRGDHR
jgi:hypothetical protein